MLPAVQLTVSITALTGLVAILALRPRSAGWAALGVAVALLLLVTGVAPGSTVNLLLDSTVPLVLFLTGAIWLALHAERVGLARRIAELLLVAARGRPSLLLALVALVAGALTATVSLDGAIVLVVPLIAELALSCPELKAAFLAVAIGVTNAFSFAVPQGNPANLVVIRRLGLDPSAFVRQLAPPAVVATIICVVAVLLLERRALGRAVIRRSTHRAEVGGDRSAVLALVAAAIAGSVAPWLGIASWIPITVVAAAAWLVLRLRGRRPVRLPVPWRVGAQIASLVVCAEAFVHASGVPQARASSLGGLLVVALAVAALSSLVNNLPASVLVAGILAGPATTAYASLIGLGPGALATPHGSVATMLAFERSGEHPRLGAYARRWLAISALAVAAAVVALRLA